MYSSSGEVPLNLNPATFTRSDSYYQDIPDRFRPNAPVQGSQAIPAAAFDTSAGPNERLHGRYNSEPNHYNPEPMQRRPDFSDQGQVYRPQAAASVSRVNKEPVNTGLLMGLDKQSEKALKRAKQEEYRRQLDQTKPKQEQIPAIQSAVVESDQYLHTGTRAHPQVVAGGGGGPRAVPPVGYDKRSEPSYPQQRPGPAYVPLPLSNQQDPFGYPPDHVDDYPYSSSAWRAPPPAASVDPRIFAEMAPGRDAYPSQSQQYHEPAQPPYRQGKAQGWSSSSVSQDYPGRATPAQQAPYGGSAYGNPATVDRRQQAPPQGLPSRNVESEKDQAVLAKKRQQEEYRRELERQMKQKQALKDAEKREKEEEDLKFLQVISAANAGDNANQRKKKGAPQAFGQSAAPPSQQVPLQVPSQQPHRDMHDGPPERSGPPRVNVPVGAGGDYADDIEREYLKLKAQMAAMDSRQAAAGQPQSRAELFEQDSQLSRDHHLDRERGDRGDRAVRQSQVPDDPRELAAEAWMQERTRNDRGGPRRLQPEPGDENRSAPGDRGDYAGGDSSRRLSVDVDDSVQPAAVSPFKSPNEARTRFMQDIYGGKSLISHVEQAPGPGGASGGGPGNWRPSVGDSNDRRRQVIAEQRAALDKQVEADRVRKLQEQADEEERDRKKEKSDLIALAKREEALAAEKKKVNSIFAIFL